MSRAVFFDFDGLILDTESCEVDAWQEVFANHGQEFLDEYWIQALGRGADEIEQRPEAILESLLAGAKGRDNLLAEYRALRLAKVLAEPIRPGVVELATEARHLGWSADVVSSSNRAWVEGHLERLEIRPRFGRLTCREDAPRAKPAPDLYNLALQKANVTADQAIALEDSPNGVAAAMAAGIYTIAVPNPLTARLDLSAAREVRSSLVNLRLEDLAPA